MRRKSTAPLLVRHISQILLSAARPVQDSQPDRQSMRMNPVSCSDHARTSSRESILPSSYESPREQIAAHSGSLARLRTMPRATTATPPRLSQWYAKDLFESSLCADLAAPTPDLLLSFACESRAVSSAGLFASASRSIVLLGRRSGPMCFCGSSMIRHSSARHGLSMCI